jgi:hypothetical protein
MDMPLHLRQTFRDMTVRWRHPGHAADSSRFVADQYASSKEAAGISVEQKLHGMPLATVSSSELTTCSAMEPLSSTHVR